MGRDGRLLQDWHTGRLTIRFSTSKGPRSSRAPTEGGESRSVVASVPSGERDISRLRFPSLSPSASGTPRFIVVAIDLATGGWFDLINGTGIALPTALGPNRSLKSFLAP